MDNIFIENYKTIQKNNRKKDLFLAISKLFFVLMLLYYGWFQMVYYTLPNMSFMLGSIMMYFILLHILVYKTDFLSCITPELLLWFVFAYTSICFGMVVAVNTSYLLYSATTFMEHLIMIYAMVYISTYDKKMDFIINSYIFFSLVCAVYTVMFGVYTFSGRISMSASTNPNTLGICMVIGVFCVLYKMKLEKILPNLLCFSTILLFLYVIILTGSRKSLLSVAIILVCWLVFVRKDLFKYTKKHSAKKTILFVLGVVVGGYIIFLVLVDSPLLIRLQQLFEIGDDSRVNMYKQAFALFKQNPIVGIGMNNFRSFYGTYSHSTYSEVLACTGMVGTVLYFTPYLLLIKKIFLLSKNNNLNVAKGAKQLGALLIMLIFLATGVIHFYSMNASIAFGFIITFCKMHNKKILCG